MKLKYKDKGTDTHGVNLNTTKGQHGTRLRNLCAQETTSANNFEMAAVSIKVHIWVSLKLALINVRE